MYEGFTNLYFLRNSVTISSQYSQLNVIKLLNFTSLIGDMYLGIMYISLTMSELVEYQYQSHLYFFFMNLLFIIICLYFC